jgi:hypothetical protein
MVRPTLPLLTRAVQKSVCALYPAKWGCLPVHVCMWLRIPPPKKVRGWAAFFDSSEFRSLGRNQYGFYESPCPPLTGAPAVRPPLKRHHTSSAVRVSGGLSHRSVPQTQFCKYFYHTYTRPFSKPEKRGKRSPTPVKEVKLDEFGSRRCRVITTVNNLRQDQSRRRRT